MCKREQKSVLVNSDAHSSQAVSSFHWFSQPRTLSRRTVRMSADTVYRSTNTKQWNTYAAFSHPPICAKDSWVAEMYVYCIRVACMHAATQATLRIARVRFATSGEIHLSFKCVDAWYTRYGIRTTNEYLKRNADALNFTWRRTNIKNQFVLYEYPNQRQSIHSQWKIDRSIWIHKLDSAVECELNKNKIC